MTDLLNKYKKENYDVYLASSAFEPVIAELAKKLNVKCIANPLKGKWSKYDRIKKSFNVKELSMAHFYSDNFEDSNISNLVKKFFPIVHDDAELMFWQKKSIGTSNIIKLNFNKETQHVSEYHSINKDSKKLINFPLFYYIKSRPGFLTLLLLNDFLPIFLAAIFLEGFSFFTSIFSTAFLLIFFYSVYEIGGFLNDFIDYKKTPKQKNQRIDPKIQ
ncbi:hypothetical protein SDC9_104225 [bioreactor metagenome]|uniref:Uncharacterized protein n=1 Tax=bioreactor metagenome TaxID=1076179 RepID=A0A645B2K5_9ZZZZ